MGRCSPGGSCAAEQRGEKRARVRNWAGRGRMRRGRAGEGGLGWGFEGVCWGGVVAVAVEGSGCSGPGLSPSRPPQPSTFFWLPYPQVLHPSIGAFSWSQPPPEEPSSPLGLLRQSHTGAQTALDIHQRGGFSSPPISRVPTPALPKGVISNPDYPGRLLRFTGGQTGQPRLSPSSEHRGVPIPSPRHMPMPGRGSLLLTC